METIVLDSIPFEPELGALLKTLRLEPDSKHAHRVRQLAAEAQALARPRAVYREAYVEARDEGSVTIDGVRLTSRVLRVNLEQAQRAFPFVATCGRELEAWAGAIEDMLERYYADAIMESALLTAQCTFEADLEARFALGHTAAMNPGSLADWPLREQAPLFALLGDVRGAIGVELTDSYLMLPIKSVSGLCFPTEVSYVNCQLCPRPQCPGRRAPYDKDLYEQRYH